MSDGAISIFDSTWPDAAWSLHARCSSVIRCEHDPFPALEQIQSDRRHRWIGFISYDCGRFFETIPSAAFDDLHVPLLAFAQISEAVSPAALPLQGPRRIEDILTSTFTRQQYYRAVQRCIDYIKDGDVYQVNLSQRFTVPLYESPFGIYRRLQRNTAARYGAFLDFGDFQIISNSPELFLRVTPDHRIATRPIKGTRPKGPGLQEELRASEKDQAELAMIVDVERNDLGRVCEIGSVRIVEPRAIEEHPTLYHGVATIEGKLRADVTLLDLLRATFPGGSVTGAPKIRAMQIIDQLEPVRRGPYCGAIGYIDPDGTMEFSIAIRTMIIKDGLIHLSVGGGIVADSDPAAEYEETLVKAQAMFNAIGVSANSVDSMIR